METLKTAVVVVLLLAVLYGAYVVLNKPDAQIPDDIAWYEKNSEDPPSIEMPGVAADGAAAGLPGPGFDLATGAGQQHASSDFSTHPHDPHSAVGAPYQPPVAGNAYQPDSNVQPGAALPTDAAQPGGDFDYDRGATPRSTPGYGGQYAPAPKSSYDGAADSGYSRPSPSNTPSNDPPTGGAPSPGSAYAQAPAAQTDEELPDGVQRNPYVKPGAGSAANTDSASIGAYGFEQAWSAAQNQIARQQWRAALASLSVFYNSPDLTPEQHEQLLSMLDPLAGKVIYSREHLLTDPHVVRRGENLGDIADQFNTPWRLLQKINGIENPEVLTPGDELKVVPGPFGADVDLVRQELTLFIDGMYAGRFPISAGQDPAPREGEYQVRAKQEGRQYFARDGRAFEPGHPANPYGNVWVDLGGRMCIHGSQAAQTADSTALGCISLSPRDAEDVFDILSHNSRVTIRR